MSEIEIHKVLQQELSTIVKEELNNIASEVASQPSILQPICARQSISTRWIS